MRTTTSLSFSWDPPAPRAGVDAPTRYIVRCDPQLEGIDTPALVNQSATQLTATVMGLLLGVPYSCSVTAMNDRGEGDPAEQSGTTLETGQCEVCNQYKIVYKMLWIVGRNVILRSSTISQVHILFSLV